MTLEAPTLDMTIVDSPDAKNDAVSLEGTRRQGALQHADQIKLCTDCCNSELGHPLVCWS
jgi:hypothetical protein